MEMRGELSALIDHSDPACKVHRWRSPADEPLSAPARRIHNPLGTTGASSERSNSLQIISPEGETMSKSDYLQQAAKAERLARDVFDSLTLERLRAFAAECRAKAQVLAA